ncbi:MAG TPA: hypothetical protein DGB72_02725 [Gemmatimonadetes bacterium]|jgi:hypothetical protein|nr:hypothetical protein [Gemmatimonadota bacterium]
MEAFQVHPHSLDWLLSTIHEGQLALPDFQRDFVWDPRATEELIESISRSFPAGSLLFMPYRERTFRPRAVANAPEVTAPPSKLILDGQQRLTSLYQAFYGVGDSRYFIDLQVLLDTGDVEEAIFYRHHTRCGRYGDIKQQAAQLVLPLGVLFGVKGGFDAWIDEVIDLRPEEGEERRALKARLRDVHQTHVKTIETYRFPVIELDPTTELEAICSIFETLNRTGVRLTVFELLAARFYADDLDLRRLWEETLASRALIAEFEIDPYYVLQSVALRKTSSCQRADVLKLRREDLDKHWDAVADGYEQALHMLRHECGVLTRKWLPYQYLLVPLAASWREATGVTGPLEGRNKQKLQQWFWCSSFSQTYEFAANTQAARDYVEIIRWLSEGPPPEPVGEFALEPGRLREVTPRQQSIYKATISVVLRHGAKDFHTAGPITPAGIAAHGVDDHHIFPRAFLRDRVAELGLVDCVLNRTMIDATTNRRIGARAPSDYLDEMEGELEEVALSGLLESHLLPAERDSPLRTDRFEAFISAREASLEREIRRLTGAVVAVESVESALPA